MREQDTSQSTRMNKGTKTQLQKVKEISTEFPFCPSQQSN